MPEASRAVAATARASDLLERLVREHGPLWRFLCARCRSSVAGAQRRKTRIARHP